MAQNIYLGVLRIKLNVPPLVDSDGGTNKLSLMQSAATQDVQRYFAKHLIESL